jgi:hypothetical protein
MLKLVGFLKRKPGMSMEDFRSHYENNHAPLAVNLLPLMIDYRRSYLISDEPFQADHVPGNESKPDFDAVVEIWYLNRAEYEESLETLRRTDVGRQLLEDEERFMDRSAIRLYLTDEVSTSSALISRGRVAAGREPI